VAVLRRGVPVLHAICAVAGAVFGAARNGAGAAAGSAGGGAAGNVARRFDDGDASAAERRKPVRRSRRGGGAGAGDLVGKAAGVDFEDSGDDGTSSQRVPVGGGAAELRGRGMSGGSSAATNVSICGWIASFIEFILECWNTFEPKRRLGRADGYFTTEFTGPHPRVFLPKSPESIENTAVTKNMMTKESARISKERAYVKKKRIS